MYLFYICVYIYICIKYLYTYQDTHCYVFVCTLIVNKYEYIFVSYMCIYIYTYIKYLYLSIYSL